MTERKDPCFITSLGATDIQYMVGDEPGPVLVEYSIAQDPSDPNAPQVTFLLDLEEVDEIIADLTRALESANRIRESLGGAGEDSEDV